MHPLRNHGDKSGDPRGIQCEEPSCDTLFRNITELREHLTEAHGLQFETINTEFSTMTAFERWITEVEDGECVRFMNKSEKHLSDYERDYFCRRNSLCSANGENLNCTAHLVVRRHNLYGTITVTGCLTHYGHSKTTGQFIKPILKRPRNGECGVTRLGVDMTAVRDKLLTIYRVRQRKRSTIPSAATPIPDDNF